MAIGAAAATFVLLVLGLGVWIGTRSTSTTQNNAPATDVAPSTSGAVTTTSKIATTTTTTDPALDAMQSWLSQEAMPAYQKITDKQVELANAAKRQQAVGSTDISPICPGVYDLQQLEVVAQTDVPPAPDAEVNIRWNACLNAVAAHTAVFIDACKAWNAHDLDSVALDLQRMNSLGPAATQAQTDWLASIAKYQPDR